MVRLRSVGLSPDAVKILVNDRMLAESQLDNIGIGPERHPLAFRLIDRRDRMPPEKWADWSLEEGLSLGELEQLQGLLDDREAWRSSAPPQPSQRSGCSTSGGGAVTTSQSPQYQTGMRWPHQSWREMHQSRIFSIQFV